MNNAVGLAVDGHLTSSHVVLPTTMVGSLEFLGCELVNPERLLRSNFLVRPKPMQPNINKHKCLEECPVYDLEIYPMIHHDQNKHRTCSVYRNCVMCSISFSLFLRDVLYLDLYVSLFTRY
jgi:hypothetical protein